ncbi:MAG: C39 family peptidase [Ignavibacteria bacterium]
MKKLSIAIFIVSLIFLLFHINSNYLKSEERGIINVYQYLQCGQSWSSSQLGTCSGLTMCSDGCAVVCMAMLLKTNGVNVNPGQLNTWLTNNGGYSGGCLIIWGTAVQYPGSTVTFAGSIGYSLSAIKSKIDAGSPVIVNVTTTVNHFIVVKGYNGSGTSTSDFVVLDPLYQSERLLSNYNTIVGLRTFNNVTSGSGYAKVSQGVSVNPNPVISGGSLQATFTLQETGGAAITFDTVVCAVLYNNNGFIFDLTKATNITIPPGGTYNYNATGYFSSSLPLGTYKAVARGYKIGTGWFDFTTTGSGVNPLSFQVVNAALLPPPTLVSPGSSSPPGNIIYTLTPTMQWQAVSGALKYGLYIKDTLSGILVLDDSVFTGTSYTLPPGILQWSRPYRWNMRTYNSAGQPSSSFSSRLYFKTQSPSGINQINNEIPKSHELYQNYPNPFNPATTIKFDITTKSDVQIIIYDIRGSEVYNNYESELPAGQYSYQFDGSSLSSGLYFCKLISKDYSKTIKLNLIK